MSKQIDHRSQTTTDRKKIRKWAQERCARPATVKKHQAMAYVSSPAMRRGGYLKSKDLGGCAEVILLRAQEY
ncbi:MAG: hypothetical protein JO170_25835 [Verrucomicrobia bacterium]|nr:hypothetical protein [Verrucomicrobiota bacterium]